MTDALVEAAEREPEPEPEQAAEQPAGAETTGSRRDWWNRRAPLLLVGAPVLFNLWVLRDERISVNNLNDSSVHLAMVRWAETRIRAGHLPFDGWFPTLSAGDPQFHQYQSLAHIIAGYIAVVFGAVTTMQWSLYLGLALWPIAVYCGARLFNIERIPAGCAALVSPLIISASGYGYEHGSYTWRGLGVWSQLWGMWLLPFALPLTWRAIRRGKGYALAALVLGLTVAIHFLTGYLALLGVGVWVLIKPSEFKRRIPRALLVGVSSLLIIAWVVVPLLSDSKWAAQSVFNRNTFFDDSFGAQKILGWLFAGQIFDFGRWPVVSLLVAAGFLVCVTRFRRDETSRALIGFTLLSLVIFFGRPTLGPLLKLLPGNGDLFLHRFLMGVQLGGIWMAGVGAAWLGRAAAQGVRRVKPVSVRILAPVGAVALAIFLSPAFTQTQHLDAEGASWIRTQRAVDATYGADVQQLVDTAQALGPGRFYAGTPGGWGHQYDVYSVPVYIELLDRNVDSIGFTLRTEALTSDPEAYFDDTNPDQYDLFNIAYVILPADHRPPPGATFIAVAGPDRLYSMPTTGYLEVVDTVGPAITADRTTMNLEPTQFMQSPMLHDRKFPTVAFAGAPAAAPTVPMGTQVTGSPGSVGAQFDLPTDGVFGGEVTLNRKAVVLLKASYNPRWKVTIDGKPAKIEMVAPSFVGVTVPAGTHRIEFHYESYQYYWLLFLVGAMTLLGLIVVPRRLARRRSAATEHPGEAPPAAPCAADAPPEARSLHSDLESPPDDPTARSTAAT
jgi:hypothetical protein